MTEHNGQHEPKRIVSIDWQDESGFDIPLQLRPMPDVQPLFPTTLAARPDTTPPFRKAS